MASAGKYTLTFYTKGNGTLWFYSNWGEWARFTNDEGALQADGWKKHVKEIDLDGANDTSFLFHHEGAMDLYIDDISFTDANGVNYVIDGGFGEVTVKEDEPVAPVVPDAKLTLSSTTSPSSW